MGEGCLSGRTPGLCSTRNQLLTAETGTMAFAYCESGGFAVSGWVLDLGVCEFGAAIEEIVLLKLAARLCVVGRVCSVFRWGRRARNWPVLLIGT